MYCAVGGSIPDADGWGEQALFDRAVTLRIQQAAEKVEVRSAHSGAK
jgi:hypothetical protein